MLYMVYLRHWILSCIYWFGLTISDYTAEQDAGFYQTNALNVDILLIQRE